MTSFDEKSQDSYQNEIDKISEEYDRLLLKQLALEHSFKEARQLDSDGLPFERGALDRNIQEMLNSCQKQRNRKRALKAIGKFSARAASFVVVAAIGFIALFFSVDAVKLGVVDLIARSYEISTHFNVEDMTGKIPQEVPPLTEAEFKHPTYLPNGFNEVAYDFNNMHGYMSFEKSGDPYVLTYSCMVLSSAVSLDTEDCLMEEKDINGHKAYLYTKYRGELKGHTSLIWYDGSYIRLISGPVSQREIIRMAESV